MSKDKRFSVLYPELDCCCICGSPYIEKHEVFYGKGIREKSIKYGLVIPLCAKHHRDSKEGIHFNKEINLNYKRMAQKKFEETHTREEFIKEFRKSVL